MISRSLAEKCLSAVMIAFGLVVAWMGLDLSIGRLARIGPGLFPVCLGILLIVFVIGTFFERPVTEEGEPAEFDIRAMVSVGAALLAFALLAENVGLIPAIIAMVVIMALGMGRPSLKAMLLTVVLLSAIGLFLFIDLLRLPLQPFAIG